MTISSTTRYVTFTGNGSASVFTFTFKVFSAADLAVTTQNSTTGVVTTLILSTGYTVSLNANQDTSPGGTITLTAGALATGYTLTITSAIPNTQPTQFINQGGFYPETLNGALDRLTILIQQLQTAVSQSVKNLTYYPAAPVISGSTYQAPGNVAAVFVNGAAQSTTDYSVNGSHLITFNYTLNGSDVVYALCTS